MPEKIYPPKTESLAQSFKIIDIARERVLLEGLGAIGFATSQRVEVIHPIGIRQRREVRMEIIMRDAGSARNQDERRS
jgi:hypothetical protein